MAKFRPNTMERINLPIIIGSAGVLIIILFLLLASGNKKPAKNTEKLAAHIKTLETRLDALEAKEAEKAERIRNLENAVNEFNNTFEQLKALPNEMENLLKKIEYINKRQGNLEKKVAGVRPRRRSPPKTTHQKTSQKTSTAKYHLVQPGETLFSISQRYGLTLDQLRRINNLSPEMVIQPGQRLKVSK